MIPCALLPLLLANPAPEAPQPVTPPAPLIVDEEVEGWSGGITAGAIITTGNTETKSATITGNALWKRDENVFAASVLWNYQGDRSGVTQRKLYGEGQFDHFYTETFYSYGKVSADHDFGANLDLRWTAGAGAGHEFRNDDQWTLSGEAGLSYVDESYKSIAGTPSEGEGYLALRLAYGTAYNGSEVWEFYHGGEVYPSLEDKDDVYARFDTGAKTNLTDAMFAQLQWIFDYDNTPATGSDRKSSLIALTLGWTF